MRRGTSNLPGGTGAYTVPFSHVFMAGSPFSTAPSRAQNRRQRAEFQRPALPPDGIVRFPRCIRPVSEASSFLKGGLLLLEKARRPRAANRALFPGAGKGRRKELNRYFGQIRTAGTAGAQITGGESGSPGKGSGRTGASFSPSAAA